MVIGIEASRANRPQKTGVEWYGYHMIQHLKRLSEADQHSWLLYGNTPLTHGLEIGPPAWHEVRLPWPPKYLWTQGCLSLEMQRRPPDVLYVPSHVLPRVIPKKTVVVIHDVGFRRLPDLYKPIQRAYHEWTTRDIVKRASRILTVSEFSKQEIVETFKASPDQIQVIYPGIDHDRYYRRDAADMRRVLERFQIPKPFFLYIGRIELKKNVGMIIKAFEKVVIEAFEKFKDRRGVGDPFRLVLVGQPGAGYEEVERLIAKSPIREMIHVTGYVNEEEKIALLSSAAALIHPAWYEGFGIPIVEAMATGCPVICSKVASLPEVAGEHHVLWFDPTNVYDLVKQMSVALHPDTEQEKRARAAMEWSRRYTWEQAAQQTFKALTDWS